MPNTIGQTADVVTAENAIEHRTHRFVTEASQLGIRPGHLADYLRTDLGNGQAFLLQRVDSDGTAYYTQANGCLFLTVFND